MIKKVLYTANTYRHLYLCHKPYIKWLNDKGFIVHTASNSSLKLEGVEESFCLPIKRNPFKLSNIKSIFMLKRIIENEKYDLIHTNTPMGAVVTRLAAIKYKKRSNVKIIYTAHGFHFFKKCPWINYILFYPIEKILSKYTDLIITMNEEDYNFALKHFKTKIEYIPGIGFDENKFNNVLSENKKRKLRNELGIENSDYIISYVAEISSRKRQQYLLDVLRNMNLTDEKILLIGDDSKAKKLKKNINKYELQDKIMILGFRDNVSDYLDISDLIISVSKQEGLPMNIMEAMYKKKPIIVTDCRGNRDLIKNGFNGIVVGINDKDALSNSIKLLKSKPDYAQRLANRNIEIIGEYSIKSVLPIMVKIYENVMGENHNA